MMNKNLFKNKLVELIKDDEALSEGSSINEAIYIIDDVIVYGGFEEGYRGTDHNVLKFTDVEWKDILNYGTLIVPETATYISDEINEDLELAGLTRLPLNDNHIVGFKNIADF